MTDSPRRLIAIMFTDIVGYSAMTQRDEAMTLKLLDEHNKLVRAALVAHAGREIKTVGDAFLVAFESALEAVQCAMRIQTDLKVRNAVAAVPIVLRIGVHLGDVIYREGDVFGDGVNIAARVQGSTSAGEIRISEDVARQVVNKIAPRLRDLGVVPLKNIKQPVRLYGIEGFGDPATLYIPVQTVAAPMLDATPSIAVLAFANRSGSPDDEYFSDGLADELLNALAKINGLRVAAHTSAFSFKGKSSTIAEIGRVLNVGTILEGSVRKSGSRVRISVQLVKVADGYQLWSSSYDRTLDDIFAVQDEIALSVVEALKLKLFGEEKAAVLKRFTDDAKVHELFLRGRYHAYKYTAEGWKRAIESFQKAVAKMPDYAPAHAGMSVCYGCLWYFGIVPAEQSIPQSKAAFTRALEIDENLADARMSSALISFFHDWEWEKAEREFKRSIALSPHNAEALSYYALFLAIAERYDEAITANSRALEIDPLSPLINMNIGWAYLSSGGSAEALSQADKMIEVEPGFYGAYWLKGETHRSAGRYEAAIKNLQQAVSLGGPPIVSADLASTYGLAGRQDEFAAMLAQLLEKQQKDYVPPICLARIYSRVGDNDKAVEWLEKAFAERNGELVFLKGELDSTTDAESPTSLARNPKLMALLQKMNLPHSLT